MKLIIGLGNPGKKYETTRHNAGVMAIKKFFDLNSPSFAAFKFKKKIKSLISQGELNDEEIILALPQTYMNNSGQTALALVSYYKIDPTDLWIIHDDLDLPLGKIRLSRQSSSGGHRGVQSIIDRLKTKGFVRFRLGIAKETKPKLAAEKFVLRNFESKEKELLEKSLKRTAAALELTIKSGLSTAMNKFN